MSTLPRRPFYAEYAWAFDLLIDRPIQKECAVIAGWLVDRGILPQPVRLSPGCVRWCWADVELALSSLSAGKAIADGDDPFLRGVRNATSAA